MRDPWQQRAQRAAVAGRLPSSCVVERNIGLALITGSIPVRFAVAHEVQRDARPQEGNPILGLAQLPSPLMDRRCRGVLALNAPNVIATVDVVDLTRHAA